MLSFLSLTQIFLITCGCQLLYCYQLLWGASTCSLFLTLYALFFDWLAFENEFLSPKNHHL